MPAFESRLQAGRTLAEHLKGFAGKNAVVVGLARGGVVVALPIAENLGLPLRALVIRKVGAPGNSELALGAVSQTGYQWLDERVVSAAHADATYLQKEIETQRDEARRRSTLYDTASNSPDLAGKIAVIVDDGIATGASALVAVRSARELLAACVVLTAPVASEQAARNLGREADEVNFLSIPVPFMAVGYHYENFDQATDDDVMHCLRQAGTRKNL